MAVRKKATQKIYTSPNVLMFKRIIFKQRKVLKGVRALKPFATELALARIQSIYAVKKLKNGLLNMRNTPVWTIEVSKRNTTESPLLRLPGELRNKIWRFATAGNIVNLHDDEKRPDVLVCKGHTVGIVGKDNPLRWLSTRAEDKPRLPSAFHLPEVCRQIYHEVGTLAYSDSIFFFCNWNDEGVLIRTWAPALTPAHRHAIRDVAVDDANFDFYLEYGVALRSAFPGLRRLHLNRNRVNAVFVEPSRARSKGFVHRERNRLEDGKQKKVDKREGGMMELVWHDNPIEDYAM
ncbi:hypothetical protein PMIN06_012107 [Paraphaeosphaeria minitans]